MIDVVPAIIPKSKENLSAELALLRGKVPFVQIDISNDTFAPSITWPFSDGEGFNQVIKGEGALPFWEDFQFEIDMLVQKPEDFIDDWVQAGASRLIIHLETTEKLEEIREKVKQADMELGLSINPSTPLDLLIGNLEHADFIQFMGSDEIGFHGVKLDEKVLEMIKSLREKDSEIIIAIDIGVNEKTAPKLIKAGVTKLVSGSAILEAEDISNQIEKFRNLE